MGYFVLSELLPSIEKTPVSSKQLRGWQLRPALWTSSYHKTQFKSSHSAQINYIQGQEQRAEWSAGISWRQPGWTEKQHWRILPCPCPFLLQFNTEHLSSARQRENTALPTSLTLSVQSNPLGNRIPTFSTPCSRNIYEEQTCQWKKHDNWFPQSFMILCHWS